MAKSLDLVTFGETMLIYKPAPPAATGGTPLTTGASMVVQAVGGAEIVLLRVRSARIARCGCGRCAWVRRATRRRERHIGLRARGAVPPPLTHDPSRLPRPAVSPSTQVKSSRHVP